MRSFSRTKIINKGFQVDLPIPDWIVNEIMEDYFKKQLRYMKYMPDALSNLVHLDHLNSLIDQILYW